MLLIPTMLAMTISLNMHSNRQMFYGSCSSVATCQEGVHFESACKKNHTAAPYRTDIKHWEISLYIKYSEGYNAASFART